MSEVGRKQIKNISFDNTRVKTYVLPEYLPDITEYVYFATEDKWISKKEAISKAKTERKYLYLSDKSVIIDKWRYELEHNIENKYDNVNLSNILTLPINILRNIIKYLTSNSISMFYRMCLVSKNIKDLTIENTDYSLLMSISKIGRLDESHLENCRVEIINGVIDSGNFRMDSFLSTTGLYYRLLFRIKDIKWSTEFGKRIMKTLELVRYSDTTRDRILSILKCFDFTSEEKGKAIKYMKCMDISRLI